ncbi:MULTISPECIES: YveK family protein [unclassified Adlercreutzia]|uniref:YveK family protein n=1 Tax=unclassified Adlercreutzia TaxID=2636013 RepID=UPI0013EAB739|nr:MULTISPECIES: Wzz/FepE/Etk N-terminal domain-containing protein [unclassified Adlercreutzia]
MTLLELLGLIRKKWYLVVIFPLLCGLGTAAYCWGFMADEYTSTMSLYVLTKSDDASGQSSLSSADMAASQQLANDLAVLVESDGVLEDTANAIGMSNLDDFEIEVQSETTNRVITLLVTGKRPEAVAMVANELAEKTADAAVEIMDLRAVNIIDEAKVPTAPSGPNRILYTLVGALAGLFLAVAIIVLQDLLDTTVKSDEEFEQLFSIPVLGNMPTVKKGR